VVLSSSSSSSLFEKTTAWLSKSKAEVFFEEYGVVAFVVRVFFSSSFLFCLFFGQSRVCTSKTLNSCPRREFFLFFLLLLLLLLCCWCSCVCVRVFSTCKIIKSSLGRFEPFLFHPFVCLSRRRRREKRGEKKKRSLFFSLVREWFSLWNKYPSSSSSIEICNRHISNPETGTFLARPNAKTHTST